MIAAIPEEIELHAVGISFLQKKGHGLVAEFVYGVSGKRPYLPLDGSPFHDAQNFKKMFVESGKGCLIIFPEFKYPPPVWVS